MRNVKDFEIQKRREDAFAKAKALRSQSKREEYILKEGEIIFTTGKYVGKTMAEVWEMGAEQRDYIARQVGSDSNLDIRKLFLQLLCK